MEWVGGRKAVWLGSLLSGMGAVLIYSWQKSLSALLALSGGVLAVELSAGFMLLF